MDAEAIEKIRQRSGTIRLSFKQIREEGGDCCCPYEVNTNRECYLWELISAILQQREWGDVDIVNGDETTRLSYKRDVITNTNISVSDFERKVKKISAYGGWTYMSYKVVLEK